MKQSTLLRRALLGAAVFTLLQHGVLAWAGAPASDVAPVAGNRPSLGSLTPQPANMPPPAGLVDDQATTGASQGDVATLMQLIHDAQLVELRTTYNASYGASLFFYPPEMTYYVVLFQDKHFWRVIRSQDDTRAEAIYANFVQQTQRLAEVEIRRTQIEAQKAFIDRVIAINEDRARRLQADLNVARTQQARVDDYQRQMQGNARALNAEKIQAQTQLRDLQNQVDQLQRETEVGLPGSRR
ncbi:DUF2968 domain-containing protein [Paraburkholderia pallida]|uniref:DUF2968 domain-containing protein n=1 Tax=Paraburkholderia pallida TaxID=2547399 RepID=A0A4P7CPX8_9BURK|nr:DUF2968 domain-containing protein [Paraburkholderia pallida]QBQ96997.1 DUF2968 domain-containing protein [Paraburkholderia pallida]